jgi:hypothetical protein
MEWRTGGLVPTYTDGETFAWVIGPPSLPSAEDLLLLPGELILSDDTTLKQPCELLQFIGNGAWSGTGRLATPQYCLQYEAEDEDSPAETNDAPIDHRLLPGSCSALIGVIRQLSAHCVGDVGAGS